jgi:hypothetical protein
MRTWAMMGVCAALCWGAVAAAAAEAAREPSGLIVHEWGTFTTIAGGQGVALEWRPLAGPGDLPGFVYDIGNPTTGFRHGSNIAPFDKNRLSALVRMETPVLYFYAEREMEVEVSVSFRGGRITEWYPFARSVSGGFIDWGRIKVMPGAQAVLPTESAPSHYYPARATDAALVRVCGTDSHQYEKFLFYRGVGTFELPLQVKLEGERVLVSDPNGGEVGAVILFENRDGKVGYRLRVADGSGESAVWMNRPALGEELEPVLAELYGLLTGRGLYEKEARAMIETWREQWFEEGLRVFYLLDDEFTDRVLPLQVMPRPDELARVMVVRTEIVTPEMEEALTNIIVRLDDESPAARATARADLAGRGRFAEPVLKRLLAATPDAQVQSRIEQLLAGRL